MQRDGPRCPSFGRDAGAVLAHQAQFLEHIPEIDRKYDGSVQRTAQVIEANGFQIDWPLWEKDFAKCTPCHPGSNCH